MSIKIKNWHKFQHFKDRRPPWIKLYRELLDDRQFHALSGDDTKSLIMLWLLASENFGKLPDMESIAFRLRKSEDEIKLTVSRLCGWLEQDDIGLISERYHDDTPETETETIPETEGEAEREGEKGEFSAAVEAYNFVAMKHTLPRCQNLTEARKKALRRRLKESGGVEGWKHACDLLDRSAFLTGKNDRGWRANFDFMLQAKSFTKLMEGGYDSFKSPGGKNGKPDYDERLRNAAAMDFEKTNPES